MGDAVAGSVLIELKAQIESLQKGFDKAKATIEGFGKTTETNAKRVTGSGAAMSASFNTMERRAAAAQAKFATFTSKVLGMQLALAALSGDKGGLGMVGQAMESAAKGASVAAAALHAFQGKISGAGAAALGVGVAGIDMWSQKMKATIEATNAATLAQIRSRLTLTEYSDALKAAADAAGVFGATGLQEAEKKLSIMQSLFDANLSRLRQIPEELAAIRQQLDTELGKPWGIRSDTTAAALRAQLESLQTERGNRERTNSDITKDAGATRASVALQQIGADAAAASKALSDVREIGARSLELGIAEPAEIATQRLAAAQARLMAIIQQEIKLRDAAAMPGLTDEKRAEILNQIRSLSTDVGQARGEFFSSKATVESQKRLDGLAASFSTAIGSGLRDAIMSGAKPLEALAGVGKNLFANMIDTSIAKLQTGLADIFKSLGEGVGTAITGILGVAGGIFAARAGKSSNSFHSVESRIESSQAVRGIVAGPSSVAVAALEDNLGRALVPTNLRLDKMIGILGSINGKTGRGGDVSFGSSVAST